jgi:FkbM family methyltransferase
LLSRLRDGYWRAKSTLLYEYAYRLARLEYTLQSGIPVRVASMGEWWVYNDIFVEGEYDSAIALALEDPPAQELSVLDLGANVGFFALRVADRMLRAGNKGMTATITLVEGSPRVFAELKRRLDVQRLPFSSVRLIHGLVGMRSGIGVIHESAVHVKNTIVGPEGAAGRHVPYVDLVKAMEDIPSVDLLKCDIEGAERLFVDNYGDLLSRVKRAVFELHHDLCDTRACVVALRSSGFQEVVVRQSGNRSLALFSRIASSHK